MPHGSLHVVCLVAGLAADHAIETRIRRLIEEHRAAGAEPRTLVMNLETRYRLMDEIQGYNMANYFWHPSNPTTSDDQSVSFFLGIPILIKQFVGDMEVLVGV